MPLSDSAINKIENEAMIFAEQRNSDSPAYKTGCSFGYANGAINEAERAECLVKALKDAIKMYEIALKERFKNVPEAASGSPMLNMMKTALEQFK